MNTPRVLECGSPRPPLTGYGHGQSPPGAGRLAPSKAGPLRSWLLRFILLPSVLCLCAQAQYSIDWYTVGGGGGACSGGVYSLSGTIGQADAGTMSGGAFTLTGGFWSIIAAVQTPGAPCLSLARTSTNTMLVRWPLSAANWILQATPSLSATCVWTYLPPPYPTDGTNCYLIERILPGNRFYRLYQLPAASIVIQQTNPK